MALQRRHTRLRLYKCNINKFKLISDLITGFDVMGKGMMVVTYRGAGRPLLRGHWWRLRLYRCNIN